METNSEKTKTYTVMIADAGGSEVYISGVTREHAIALIEGNKRQNAIKETGYVLYSKGLREEGY